MNFSLKDFKHMKVRETILDLATVRLEIEIEVDTGKVRYFAGQKQPHYYHLYECDNLTDALAKINHE